MKKLIIVALLGIGAYKLFAPKKGSSSTNDKALNEGMPSIIPRASNSLINNFTDNTKFHWILANYPHNTRSGRVNYLILKQVLILKKGTSYQN